MADFKEVRLPLEVSAWMVGGPMWNTRTFKVQSGDVSRIGLWQYPLHKWEISAGERAITDALATKVFQMRVRGMLYGFRVLDHFDHTVYQGEGFLVATDTPGIYQLVKRYFADGEVIERVIRKPIPGTTYLYNGSTAIGNPIDYTTGKVAVSGVSDPSILSWTGLFDTPVSFTDDWLQLGMSSGGLMNWNNAHIMELQRIDVSMGTPPTLPTAGDPAPVVGTSTFAYSDAPSSGPAPPPPPPAPTATAVVVRSGPSSGYAGQASAPFHFGLDGTPAAPVHVTLIGSGSGGTEGTWSPASITLSSGNADVIAYYTAASAGTKSLTRTNDAGLGNGAVLSYSAAAVASPPPAGGNTTAATIAPSSQSAQAGDSVSFTFTLDVTPNPGPLSFNVTSSDPNDAIVPNYLSYSGGDPVQKSFGVQTSSTAGTHTITATSTGSPAIVSNAATINVTAPPAPPPSGAPIPLTSGQAVNWTTSGSTPINYTIVVPFFGTFSNLHIESTGDVSALIAYKYGQPVNVATNTADGAYQNPGSIDATPVSPGTYYIQVYPLNPNVSGTLKATVT